MTTEAKPTMRLRTPYDTLCAVQGIVQSHILASDSCLDPRGMFGPSYVRTANLEAACAMMEELAACLEGIEWGQSA